MKITFKSEALRNLVKKIGKFTTDGCILTCTNVKAPGDEEGLFMARFSACNGTSEVTVGITYHSDEAIEKVLILNLGAKFEVSVDALADFGEEMSLCVEGEVAHLECGTATIPVDLLKDCLKLSAAKMDENTVEFSVEKDAFVAAITQGSAASEKCSTPVLSENICLFPTVDADGNPFINVVSTNCIMGTGAKMPVQCKGMDKFQKWVEEKKGMCFKTAGLLTVAGRVEKNIRTFVLKDRLVLQVDGVDLYNFVAVDGTFPAKVLDLLNIPQDTKLTVCVSKSDFKKAASVVMLSSKDKDKVVSKISFKDSQLVLEDIKGTTRIALTVTGKDEGMLYLNMKYLLRLCESVVGDSITLYGTKLAFGPSSQGLSVYIAGSDANATAFLLPVDPKNA